ncbi:MAG TPA: hypothetical protein VJ831_03485 [Jatrophihabitantaceae bacterium]|nr:hypothetical protein [Jatrophihabitantaceae bacterium]
MAKHNKRSLGMRTFAAALIAVGMTVAMGLVGAQSANALLLPEKKEIHPSNSDVLARCAIGVKSVNPLNNYETKIKLSGQAQPNNPNGYSNNVFTEVDCYLLPADHTNPADALGEIHPYSAGATVLTQSTTVTVAFADSYTLCGRAFVKLLNGNTSYTPYVCA